MAMNDPFVVQDPTITIDGVDYKCASRTASLIPDDQLTDVGTWCNPGGERPSFTNWTASFEVLMSYDAAPDTGSWNLLHALRKTKAVVVMGPSSAPVDAANPTATFSAFIPSIPFMDASIGEVQSFSLELSVIGEPVIATSL